MQNFKTLYNFKKRFFCATRLLTITALLSFHHFNTAAQSCPFNIDFETGDFTGWTCYTGSVSTAGSSNVISLIPSGGPVYNRHTMYHAPDAGFDAYGNFPVNCPNGSNHSIRLGNNLPGTEAEGVSYEFTIPANENVYNIIYNYAVVFQDPKHLVYQQPRLEIEVTNVTDNSLIQCSSFYFFANGTVLPGFQLSSNPGGNTPVWYKEWTAVSVNLDGMAGKTIRLFFKTADCTFRAHFGYAYIDVNSECSGTFVGATFCPDDTAVNVVAPYGYQGYKWFNSTFTQVLGTQQILNFSPPPPAGTLVAVELTPYNGYGCLDTLFARLVDTLTVTAQAGRDTLSCNHNPVPIGSPPKPGLVYHWSPQAGLSNPNVANPYARPDVTTMYVLTTNHDGGGCIDTDTVIVRADVISDTLELIGSAEYCIGSGDSTVLRVHAADSIQWYRNDQPIPGAHGTEFKVLQTGAYYAKLFNHTGCSIATQARYIDIAYIPVAGFTVNNPVQCFLGNSFVLINSSTIVSGNMQYRWILGDGTEETGRDVIHKYTRPGTYEIKLIVSSNATCADSRTITVIVNPNAIADFEVSPVCMNLPVQPLNKTVDPGTSPVTYLWNFGNGQTSGLKDPVVTYPSPGSYTIALSVNTVQCPGLSTIKHNILIEKPKAAVNYPFVIAVINLPLSLQSRDFGDSILWSPHIKLDNPNIAGPVFRSNTEQLYTIDIKTKSGCHTVDTQLVKVHKQIEIYVPNAFTPNEDGRNDLFRPTLIGIKKVNYFRVYNRWGNMLFEMQSDRPGWDGTYRGVRQESQTIVWMIEGLGVDGNIHRQKGTSLLLR